MRNFAKVKKLSIILTSLFIVSFELFRHTVMVPRLTSRLDIVISSALFVIASIIFSHYVFNIIEKIEKKRLQKEREANALFDNSIDGIFVFDSTGKLVDMNHGAVKMTGWRINETAATHTLFNMLQSDDKSDLNHFINKHQTSMKIEETLLKAQDGGWIPVSAALSRIPGEANKDSKIAVIVRDLTERKQMEDVIKALYTEASQKQFEAETQYRIAQKIASIRDLTADNKQSLFEAVVKEINKLLKAEFAGLFLYDFSNGVFELAGLTDPHQRQTLDESFSETRSEGRLQHQEATVVRAGEKKFSYYPLQMESMALGYLAVCGKREAFESLHQKELLRSIIYILTISLENLKMYHRMKDVAMLEERERLAREMHDGLAQVISSIHMKIQIMRASIQEKNTDVRVILQETTDELGLIVKEAYHEVRQNLFNLRMPIHTDESFIEHIRQYASRFAMQNKIDVNVDVQSCRQSSGFDLPEYTKIHVVRILQEALSNVRRHSQATKVHISINCGEPCLLSIEDNGIGFEPAAMESAGHYGLSTMKERAGLIQGRLDIHSEPDCGTQVILTLPNKGELHG